MQHVTSTSWWEKKGRPCEPEPRVRGWTNGYTRPHATKEEASVGEGSSVRRAQPGSPRRSRRERQHRVGNAPRPQFASRSEPGPGSRGEIHPALPRTSTSEQGPRRGSVVAHRAVARRRGDAPAQLNVATFMRGVPTTPWACIASARAGFDAKAWASSVESK